MQNLDLDKDIIREGITQKSLQTVSGMAVANYMVNLGIDKAFFEPLENPMPWIVLVTSVIISISVCFFVNKKRNAGALFLALLAAFPVFLGTSGMNNLLTKVKDTSKQNTATAKGSMIEIPSFLKTRSWWFGDVIDEANLKADNAIQSEQTINIDTNEKFTDVNKNMYAILENPNKAREIAQETLEISNDAQKNLNKLSDSISNPTISSKQTQTKTVDTKPPSNQTVSNQNSNTASLANKSITQLITSRQKLANIEEAKKLEMQAFQFVLKQDFAQAKNSFTACEDIKNRHNNCFELTDYLNKNSNKDAREIYKTILTEFSWGMPKDIKTAMQKYVKDSLLVR